ncbi:hypothetical protein N8I74_08585 [Chitiniphilus purpureus]|uniref:Uncharacterized protein n=1 Tax=Chitiniphilus purpureus TaxID=2981137 RepID=A0ABY6DU74_9NEIS|nr:hypothetical protein [Chitiniphilus sp. CD1]UXY17051.1 hypothetical protein N8I74_08585 [Chitiniphilus sp. CD1]
MRQALRNGFAWAALLPGIVLADPGPAASSEPAAAPRRAVIHRGEPGQTPVEAAYRYLKDRIADEYGVAPYRELRIEQRALGADAHRIALQMQLKGWPDGAVAAYRFNFALSFEAPSTWVIEQVREDWQCRRGKGWTQRPCR